MAALIVVAGLGTGVAVAAPAGVSAPAVSTRSNDLWAGPGPYAVTSNARSDSIGVLAGPLRALLGTDNVEWPRDLAFVPTQFFYPDNPASVGRPLPLVVWGNGSGAVPSFYAPLLRHLASYGFVVAASASPMPAFGVSMNLSLIQADLANTDPASPLFGRIDTTRIAAVGHSAGGQGALNMAANPRVTSTLAIQPGPLTLPPLVRSQTLVVGGDRDWIVPWFLWPQLDFYGNPNPTYLAVGRGVGHFDTLDHDPSGPLWGISTAWLLYTLRGDPDAGRFFVGENWLLPQDPDFSLVKRNARAEGVH
ncbi:hypothetical protein [Rhodococcus sp. NPDC127528]|uniref:poly(ethylene terephthalate) hydrolase family protein n=1 Tax=unclassified Rhodococcus (in: high G+C Gram-positive bacteria) TaxID=192944 RepID=UPI00362E9D33